MVFVRTKLSLSKFLMYPTYSITRIAQTVFDVFALIVLIAISVTPEISHAQSPVKASDPNTIESRLSTVGPAGFESTGRHQGMTIALPESLQGYEIARGETQTQNPQNFHSAFSDASSQQTTLHRPAASSNRSFNDLLTDQAEQMITRQGTGSSVKIAILLAALSLAPALILMTTCYVRVVVVLTLLRQAFGAQQLPSTQILTTLSLFVTFLVMAPTWNQMKTEAIEPYTESNSQMSLETAFDRAVVPVKQFMAQQIKLAKNEDSVAMFYRYLPKETGGQATPTSMDEVPLNVLMPAFLVSELKVAFLLGFQVYLPFLIVDLVVSSVTVSMGMVMLPPTMVSFPLKLILFVMVDGWTLVVGMLMQSFGPL